MNPPLLNQSEIVIQRALLAPEIPLDKASWLSGNLNWLSGITLRDPFSAENR